MSAPGEPGEPATVVRRAAGAAGGEVVLLRRGERTELVVDGVFVMDDEDGSSERLLASAALDTLSRNGSGPWRVLVGGLGLGLTVQVLLADERVGGVVVAELEPALVSWYAEGLLPLRPSPRVDVVIGDVRQVLAATAPGSLDAVLLDVDNGPGFLVHDANAGLYSPEALRQHAGRLRDGGVFAVWCADVTPGLLTALDRHVGPTTEHRVTAHRGDRDLEYAVYVATTRTHLSAGSAAPCRWAPEATTERR